MKFKKPLSAFVVSALLLGGASGALAASANLQLSLPTSEVPGGSHTQLTFTTDVPGFLTLTLNGPSGSLTLLDREEVHTAGNMFDFVAADDSGSPLSVGAYTVSGELIDQFGEATGSVSGQLTIGIPLAQQTDDEKEEGPASAKGNASASKDTASSPSSSGSSAAPAKPSSSGKKEKVVEYVASSKTTLGEQGYEIGVGVSDTVDQADAGYWGLTANASDADIWAALTRTMVSVNVGESESAYIYNSTDNGKKIGSVSGLSQGLNLIEDLDDGWSVVEAYRNEDGAFVRGYIRTNKLRTVEPSNMYGLVIDKAAQTLTVYKNGERIGSCAVSTGPPSNICIVKRPPVSLSPSPAAARSRIPAATASTPFASAATITSAKSRPPRKTARIIPSWRTSWGRRPRAATSASRTTNPPTAASTPNGFGI